MILYATGVPNLILDTSTRNQVYHTVCHTNNEVRVLSSVGQIQYLKMSVDRWISSVPVYLITRFDMLRAASAPLFYKWSVNFRPHQDWGCEAILDFSDACASWTGILRLFNNVATTRSDVLTSHNDTVESTFRIKLSGGGWQAICNRSTPISLYSLAATKYKHDMMTLYHIRHEPKNWCFKQALKHMNVLNFWIPVHIQYVRPKR